MNRAIAIQNQLSQHRIAFRSMMAALGAAWATFTLKRAIADVASTSDQAYRDFGLDKGDILKGLGQLRYELECSSSKPVARPPTCNHHEPADTKLFTANTREPLAIARVSSGL
jgi:hypothetical protein